MKEQATFKKRPPNIDSSIDEETFCTINLENEPEVFSFSHLPEPLEQFTGPKKK